ncbi:MAG TPA: pyridoxal-dependent decarboxylase [Candidatus Deferrimicrobium sp.]|nr:pyridoxal-dependent decarboxylase [Candidatus Deferrimicrobium sp.]
MAERDRPAGPATPGLDFSWHPEPELIDIRDPGVSRPALERLGADAWGAGLDYLYGHALARALGEPTRSDDLRTAFFGPSGRPSPAPAEPTPLEGLLAEFRERIAPHQLNSWHPRAYGYYTPAPLWSSIVGELLAQVTNQGVDVWHCGPAAAFIEEEVITWLCGLVGYSEGSFGLFTSGGLMANLMAMAMARDRHLARLRGLDHPPRGAELEGVRIYVSDQAHFSLERGLAILGLATEALAIVPSDARFRLQAAPVAAAIASDRAAGLTPLAIVATAGTTNTGSVDAVEELAALARQEDLWCHVDAAYGGAARLSARDAGRVPALELADSVTVDPHKWFFQAYDIGGLLVRDRAHLEATFSYEPEYYRGGGDPTRAPDAHGSGELDFYRLGLEGTRRFRALKLWLSWRHLGTPGLGRLVEMNDDLAALLARKVADSADFEACPAEPDLSVVCFRHLPDGHDGDDQASRDAIDVHQDALQAALEQSGSGFLTTTRLRGRTWLRAGILNYMATDTDLDVLLDDLRRLAMSRPLGRSSVG